MSIISGPEIERLAKRTTFADLKNGDWIWDPGQGKPRQVLRVEDYGDDRIDLCLGYGGSSQDWESYLKGAVVKLCRPDGGRILIEPFDPQWCGANSLDVHLGDTIQAYAPREVQHFSGQTTLDRILDPENPPSTVEHQVGTDGRWLLEPGRVYLAATVERFGGFGIVPVQHGRSSWGRYGLFTNVTAGFCDDSWEGHLTLELVAVEPILVRPGCRIGQIAFHTLEGDRRPYSGRYGNQGPKPVASRFHIS